MAGIEDAYIHFDNLFQSQLDLILGQFQISDPLFKRELRLTFEDYQVYKTRIGLSPANLTYDRGIVLSYSLPTQTDWILEIVNGNGKGEAKGWDRSFDEDGNKNLFLRASQTILAQRIGAFSYLGREKFQGFENQFHYWGVDATFSAAILECNLQYIHRHDTNPVYRVRKLKNDLVGGLVELTIFPTDRLIFTGLYNRFYSDPLYLNYTTFTCNISYLYFTNLRILGEYTRDFVNETNRFLVGLVSGF